MSVPAAPETFITGGTEYPVFWTLWIQALCTVKTCSIKNKNFPSCSSARNGLSLDFQIYDEKGIVSVDNLKELALGGSIVKWV